MLHQCAVGTLVVFMLMLWHFWQVGCAYAYVYFQQFDGSTTSAAKLITKNANGRNHNSYLGDPQWVGIIILYLVLGRIHITNIDAVEAGW